MNRGICEGCRRYSKNDLSDQNWYCAKSLTQQISRLVPGLVLYVKDCYSPMNENCEPPDWCDYTLEQIVADKTDEIKRVEPSKSFMSQKAQDIANRMVQTSPRRYAFGGVEQLIGEYNG